MDYPLEKLQQVRTLREQTAQSDLAQGRHRLDQADRELAGRQMRLECHRALQSKMQAQLFNQIGRKAVTLDEFETYRDNLSDLRTEEKKCREMVQQAQTLKESANTEVDRLCAVFQQRCRQSTKLKEHRKAWDTKVEEEKDRRLEEEMDEIIVNRFSRDTAAR